MKSIKKWAKVIVLDFDSYAQNGVNISSARTNVLLHTFVIFLTFIRIVVAN